MLIYFPPGIFYLAEDFRRPAEWLTMLLANSPVICVPSRRGLERARLIMCVRAVTDPYSTVIFQTAPIHCRDDLSSFCYTLRAQV